ncbi:MAG: hypothetical protein IKZ82_09115 [Clostridia bacterium]|nr:hypothetical protein [Clostridia bacterium]
MKKIISIMLALLLIAAPLRGFAENTLEPKLVAGEATLDTDVGDGRLSILCYNMEVFR